MHLVTQQLSLIWASSEALFFHDFSLLPSLEYIELSVPCRNSVYEPMSCFPRIFYTVLSWKQSLHFLQAGQLVVSVTTVSPVLLYLQIQ